MIDLDRVNDGAHFIYLDNKQSKKLHWVSSLIDKNNAVHFDSFGIAYIPLNKIKDKFTTKNRFRIESDDFIM